MTRLTTEVSVCISVGFDIRETRISNYCLLAGFVLPWEQEEDHVPHFFKKLMLYFIPKKGKYYTIPYKTRSIQMNRSLTEAIIYNCTGSNKWNFHKLFVEWLHLNC